MFDAKTIRENLKTAMSKTERELSNYLKQNSYLFYEISRCNNSYDGFFHEIELMGRQIRADFTWMYKDSSGPHWVFVEIESPKHKNLFTKKGRPKTALRNGYDQIKDWFDLLSEYKERDQIFGLNSRFELILLIGTSEMWQEEVASKWRRDIPLIHKRIDVRVRSLDIFERSIDKLEEPFLKNTKNKEFIQYLHQNFDEMKKECGCSKKNEEFNELLKFIRALYQRIGNAHLLADKI